MCSTILPVESLPRFIGFRQVKGGVSPDSLLLRETFTLFDNEDDSVDDAVLSVRVAVVTGVFFEEFKGNERSLVPDVSLLEGTFEEGRRDEAVGDIKEDDDKDLFLRLSLLVSRFFLSFPEDGVVLATEEEVAAAVKRFKDTEDRSGLDS
jgi:hypothetical protein